jgi:hypothetical protein
MTAPRTPAQMIAAALGVSQIDAAKSPLHAARAQAENTAHAEIVDQLLTRLGIDPDVALRMVTNTAPSTDTVDA